MSASSHHALEVVNTTAVPLSPPDFLQRLNDDGVLGQPFPAGATGRLLCSHPASGIDGISVIFNWHAAQAASNSLRQAMYHAESRARNSCPPMSAISAPWQYRSASSLYSPVGNVGIISFRVNGGYTFHPALLQVWALSCIIYSRKTFNCAPHKDLRKGLTWPPKELQKVLARAGVASRRKSEEFILEGETRRAPASYRKSIPEFRRFCTRRFGRFAGKTGNTRRIIRSRSNGCPRILARRRKNRIEFRPEPTASRIPRIGIQNR